MRQTSTSPDQSEQPFFKRLVRGFRRRRNDDDGVRDFHTLPLLLAAVYVDDISTSAIRITAIIIINIIIIIAGLLMQTKPDEALGPAVADQLQDVRRKTADERQEDEIVDGESPRRKHEAELRRQNLVGDRDSDHQLRMLPQN